MDWEITFDGITYQCINCAYCCSCEKWRIYLNYFDKIRLKNYEYAIEECCGDFKYRLKVDEKGCVLLNDNLCKIHLEKGIEFKPLMCRIFPFSCMIKWDGTPLLIIKHYCKGIQHGDVDKRVIEEVIELIKELYFDSFEEIINAGMEYSSKTWLYDDVEITWEEREEFGRYIFGAETFDMLLERCYEVFGYENDRLFSKIDEIKVNLMKFDTKNNEKEIIRYLLELNRREHFRKMPFYREVEKLLDIGNYLTRFSDVFIGEGDVDKQLFF
ncbi:YkgJ family cysteine cluster protein [Methanocaldococcus sp.]